MSDDVLEWQSWKRRAEAADRENGRLRAEVERLEACFSELEEEVPGAQAKLAEIRSGEPTADDYRQLVRLVVDWIREDGARGQAEELAALRAELATLREIKRVASEYVDWHGKAATLKWQIARGTLDTNRMAQDGVALSQAQEMCDLALRYLRALVAKEE